MGIASKTKSVSWMEQGKANNDTTQIHDTEMHKRHLSVV